MNHESLVTHASYNLDREETHT